jgi:capsular polysaccharide biosynthesis protein
MDHETQELDLKELFSIILSKWYVIVLFVALGVSATCMYSYMMLEDIYTTQSSMIVLVESEETSEMTNFTYGERLVDTYTELAKSEQVIDRLEELDLPYTRSQYKSMISLSGVSDTVVIKLVVEGTDKEDITLIANETMLAIQELSTQYEGFDNIEILDMAKVPMSPSGPNRMLYLAIGTVLGGMVGISVILMVEFLDTSIKTTKDIERKLRLRVLSVIPDYEHEVDTL